MVLKKGSAEVSNRHAEPLEERVRSQRRANRMQIEAPENSRPSKPMSGTGLPVFGNSAGKVTVLGP